jgi:hypothetical protein
MSMDPANGPSEISSATGLLPSRRTTTSCCFAFSRPVTLSSGLLAPNGQCGRRWVAGGTRPSRQGHREGRRWWTRRGAAPPRPKCHSRTDSTRISRDSDRRAIAAHGRPLQASIPSEISPATQGTRLQPAWFCDTHEAPQAGYSVSTATASVTAYAARARLLLAF